MAPRPLLPPRALSSPSSLEDSGGHSARVKVKYLVEKWSNESSSWVPMARFSEGSDPERREALCEALGGHVRVFDVILNIELSKETYE